MNFDIEKIKTKTLIKYPNFATIIANMDFIKSYNCTSNGHPTAGTDGKNFVYHPEFMDKLTEEEQIFILAHEVSHIALDHINRGEGKDSETWNFATDAVINDFLKDDGLTLVNGGVDMEGARKYDAETLYNKLIEEKKQDNQEKRNNNSDDNEQPNENQDVGHDTHKMWEDAVKNKMEQNSNSSETEIEREQKKNSEMGERKVFKQNREKRKENLKKLRDSLVNQSMGYSNESSSDSFNLENIGNAQSIINWQTLLRNTVNSKIDWSYKESTIEYILVTPHL